MQVKKLLLSIGVVFVLSFLSLLAWQIYLNKKLASTGMGCGGDWNYMNKCPTGATCFRINGSDNPLIGGTCKPYLIGILEGRRSIR